MSKKSRSIKPTPVQIKQRKLIRELKKASVNAFMIGSLKKCSAIKCGKDRCRAVCVFGASRHRRHSESNALRLLQQHEGPLFEVRLSRAAWGRDLGSLSLLSLKAAKQLSRRTLDKLLDTDRAFLGTDVLAIGSLKPSISPQPSGNKWRLEIHLIVAGATRDHLEVFERRQGRAHDDDFVLIDKVKNLEDSIKRVFDDTLCSWREPIDFREPTRPSQTARAEYHLWLLPKSSGALTFRFGIDQHFNKLKKAPRTIRAPKARKKRPYPVWLEKYQFGSETRERMDRFKVITENHRSRRST